MVERLSLVHACLFLAVDDPAVAEGTGLLLQEKGAHIVGSATSLTEAEEFLSKRPKINTAIIDNRIQGESGAKVADLIGTLGFIIPIIAFTSDEGKLPWAHVTIPKPNNQELADQIGEIMGDSKWLERHTPENATDLPIGRRELFRRGGSVPQINHSYRSQFHRP